MRDFFRIFDQQNLAANILGIREFALRQETLCPFCVRMQHRLVLPADIIGFLQRKLVALRFVHLLILLSAEIGIGGRQAEEKILQAVRLNSVIIILRRLQGEQFRPECAAVRFGKGCFLAEQDALLGRAHDLFCTFAQIQVIGIV